MRVLVYTDNHFCANSSIIRSKGDLYSTRLENQIKSINWAESMADEHHCDMIIHLGDFFDRADLTSQELTALRDINWNHRVEHYFLVGNHEMGSADLKFNSLNALSKIGKIIDKPTLECGYGYEFIFLPYILESNRKPLEEYIKDLWVDSWTTQEVKHRIIFSHNDISGIRYGQYESKIGFNVEEIYNNCNLFINGHLHNQTQINDKMLNLGNLTGQNFSEDAFKYSHCVAILDTDTLKVDLINNPHAFNFYKLEINSVQDCKIFDKLQNNSIVTISCPIDIVDDIRDICSQEIKIIESRIIGKPEIIKENAVESNSNLICADHIQQFKDYILNNVGSSELILSELSEL